jgi:hypothetical protein
MRTESNNTREPPSPVSGEDDYYTRLIQLDPAYRPYQHIWFKYNTEDRPEVFDGTVDILTTYLRQFLMDHPPRSTEMIETDIVALDPHRLYSDAYVRGLTMDLIGVAIDRKARRVDILVNHRNIGGSSLLDLIRYGVGGPAAVSGTPILPVNPILTLLSHVYFVGSLTRHLAFKPSNTIRSEFRRFGYQQEWVGTIETIRRLADDVCLASQRKTLVCWCPVVFARMSNTTTNDVGIVLFSYDRGMSSAALRIRIQRARRMVHGARNTSHVCGLFSKAMVFKAGMYFKSRVDLVITMARITGENRSTHGLTSFCGTFHSTMMNTSTYPYYAYIATLAETSHVTLSVTDAGFHSPPRHWLPVE